MRRARALAVPLAVGLVLAAPAAAGTQAQQADVADAIVPVTGPDVAIVPIARQVESLDAGATRLDDGAEVTIRFAADVFFAFDSADLTPEADAFLRAEVAAQLAEQAQGPIMVEGHTDAVGSDAYNDDLSRQRAEAVVRVLAEALPGAQLAAEGFGEQRPVVAETDEEGNDLPANRQRNRRVEIRFPGTGGALAAPDAPGELPDPATAPTEAP